MAIWILIEATMDHVAVRRSLGVVVRYSHGYVDRLGYPWADNEFKTAYAWHTCSWSLWNGSPQTVTVSRVYCCLTSAVTFLCQTIALSLAEGTWT